MGRKHKLEKSFEDASNSEGTEAANHNPLKILLKLGVGGTAESPSTLQEATNLENNSSPEFESTKNLIKINFKGVDRKRQISEIDSDSSSAAHDLPALKKKSQEENSFQGESKKFPGNPVMESLYKILNKLHPQLVAKDEYMFFALPVDNTIAPGYDNIISHPMDFSTMSAKIQEEEYQNLSEYRADYERMLDNAMIYNSPDTIYHKVAKKLLKVGLKQIDKEYVALDKTLQSIRKSAHSKSDSATAGSLTISSRKQRGMNKMGNKEEDSYKVVLNSSLLAGEKAKQQLAKKYGNSDNKSNPVSLSILSTQQELEELLPRMRDLSSFEPVPPPCPYFEPKPNKIAPITYALQGPFSSFVPKFDNKKSLLTKENQELINFVYGDNYGAKISDSIKSFSHGMGGCVKTFVDGLLSNLTAGSQQHLSEIFEEQTAILYKMNEFTQKRILSEQVSWGGFTAQEISSLKTLLNDGVDPSLIEKLTADQVSPNTCDILKSTNKENHQECRNLSLNLLRENYYHIRDLQTLQYARLSSGNSTPSDLENSLASQITRNLKALIELCCPGNLTHSQSLRNSVAEITNPREEVGSIGKGLKLVHEGSEKPSSADRIVQLKVVLDETASKPDSKESIPNETESILLEKSPSATNTPALPTPVSITENESVENV